MQYPRDAAGWSHAVLSTIRANQMHACYVRPVVYREYNTLGVNPLPNPVEAAIIVFTWEAYLGSGAAERRGRQDQQVDPHCTEYVARSGQKHRQLYQFGADQDGSSDRRVRRRDRAGHRRERP